MSPVCGSYSIVKIVRDAGTPTEQSWQAKMGGDRARNAFFHLDDRVKTGDAIHFDLFDEPRVLARVDPEMTMSGPSHWKAEMIPRSEWIALNRPLGPTFNVSGRAPEST